MKKVFHCSCVVPCNLVHASTKKCSRSLSELKCHWHPAFYLATLSNSFLRRPCWNLALKVGQEDHQSPTSPDQEEIAPRATPSAAESCIYAHVHTLLVYICVYQPSSRVSQSRNLGTTEEVSSVYGQTSSWIDLPSFKNKLINKNPSENCQEILQ